MSRMAPKYFEIYLEIIAIITNRSKDCFSLETMTPAFTVMWDANTMSIKFQSWLHTLCFRIIKGVVRIYSATKIILMY